jgi:hypothetical protein
MRAMLLPSPSRPLPAALATFLLGCSGPTFTVAAGGDAAVNRDARVGDAAVDHEAPSHDGGGVDHAPSDAGSKDGVCDKAKGANVYVHPGQGTIAAGVAKALAGRRATVCASAGSYQEVDLEIPSSVAVVGSAGASMTTIVGTSSMTMANLCGAAPCALVLDRGGELHGFTITAPSNTPENGIVALGADPSDMDSPPAAIWDVVLSGFQSGPGASAGVDIGGTAIVAVSDLDVGPSVVANGNAIGLFSDAKAHAVVHVLGTGNEFNGNQVHGLDFVGAASLMFDEGEASNDGNCGIRLGGSAPDGGAAPVHTITGLTAEADAVYGVAVYTPGQSLTVRSSKILPKPTMDQSNATAGLYFEYPSTNPTSVTLDLGTSADVGMNTFGVANPPPMLGAGIFLCRNQANQVVFGDFFADCPIKETTTPPSEAGSCGSVPRGYFDIVSTAPVNTGGETGCMKGK